MTANDASGARPSGITLSDLSPTDYRRAAVVLGAWINPDPDPAPIAQVVDDVMADGRLTHLFYCLLAVTSWMAPELCSTETRERVAGLVVRFASDEAHEAGQVQS